LALKTLNVHMTNLCVNVIVIIFSVCLQVIEESQYPPVITPLEISVNSYQDEFPGGVIGKIHASDQDQYDTLIFGLAHTTTGSASTILLNPASELFEIDRTDGTLVALPRLDVGEYHVNVTVSDGKFTSHSIIKVSVELVSEEMLHHAVILRFRDVSPSEFVLSHRKGFVRAVRNALGARVKDVVIISVQPSGLSAPQKVRSKRQAASRDLDVLFAVRKPQQPMAPSLSFYSADAIRKALTQHLEALEQSTGLIVEEIIRNRCSAKYCTYGECRDHIELDTTVAATPIATDVTSFVSPRHQHLVLCDCKEGYAGKLLVLCL
jgi:protocadherin Fat 1/2/3